jgi:hypothetical protein
VPIADPLAKRPPSRCIAADDWSRRFGGRMPTSAPGRNISFDPGQSDIGVRFGSRPCENVSTHRERRTSRLDCASAESNHTAHCTAQTRVGELYFLHFSNVWRFYPNQRLDLGCGSSGQAVAPSPTDWPGRSAWITWTWLPLEPPVSAIDRGRHAAFNGPHRKFRKSGGFWPFLAGISRPSSRLSRYSSLPMTTISLSSVHTVFVQMTFGSRR